MGFKVGMKFRITNKVFDNLYHILAIVDKVMVVTKYWSYYKQRWIYEIDSMYYYFINITHHNNNKLPSVQMQQWKAYEWPY